MSYVTSLVALMLVSVGLHTAALALPASTQPANCQHTQSSFNCVSYLHNYDADTIAVSIPDLHPLLGEKISVRVRGVDAAEMKGKHPCEKDAARKAKELIREVLVGAKRIDLVDVGRDKYFRILADVVVDGESVGKILLKAGLAYSYDGGTKVAPDWCKAVVGSDALPPRE